MMVVDHSTEVHEMQPPGPLTNRELWRWRVAHSPERRWLWYAGEEWTYAEFDVRVRRLASGLRDLDVGPGTRVLIGMSTRPETVATQLALAELGAVRVLLVPGLPLGELMYPIVHSEATVMVTDGPTASLLLEHRAELRSIEHLVVLSDGDGDGPVATGTGPRVHRFEDLAQASPIEDEPFDDDPHALSYVVYTSGSTGRPKGVMLKAGSLYHNGLGYADLYRFGAADTYFQPLTFGHSLASVAGLGIPMVTGGAVALAPRFRPSTFWDEVRASGSTISVLFPAHLHLLLETDDGSVPQGGTGMRQIVTHADIPPFRERFGIELGTVWGMSETLICVGSGPGYRGELGLGYVGHPFPGGEVGIFDETTFRRLGPYEYGELCLRHPMAMIGYLNDPEATAATLRDGWVRSGDRGYVDHCGRAYFAGRYKAMIKRSGENISAEEVENALEEHPEVAECVVVAVPDRLRTEEVGAVIVRYNGAEIDPGNLRSHAGERLIRWKLPRYIVVRDEPLPRLENGKIDRRAAAAMIDPQAAWDADRS
jgi:crotonobetaine/carnitine-CoA ligase